MRSGTSFFNWTLFKKNVTRWWPIWASYLVLWLFILPVYLLMSGPVFSRYAISGTFMPALVFNMIYAIFSAMAVLSHLYSARSANFFGALPVRREGQFVTLYLAGLSFLQAPDLIVSLLAALVVSAGSGLPASQAFAWLLTAAAEGFFFYSLAILVGLLVGHILALPALYAVINFIAALTLYLVEVIARVFYPSFNGFSGTAAEATAAWLTPAVRFSRVGLSSYFTAADGALAAEQGLRLAGKGTLTVYAGAALLLTAAAFLLYRSRRTESAGDVVAVRAVRPVFKFGGAVCAGLVLGTATSAVLGERTLPFTVTIWAVIGCFAAQMILDKTFRVFKKWKGAAVTAVLLAGVFAVMTFDLTGFETRVPDPEDVKSVEVEVFYSSFGLDDAGDPAHFTVTDPDQIAELVALHAAAVQGDSPWYGGGSANLEITYHTKHSILRRKLSVRIDPADADTPGTAAAALEAIFADQELWRRIYGLDEMVQALASGGQIDLEYRFYSRKYQYYDDYYVGPDYDEEQEMEYAYFQENRALEIPNVRHVRAILEALLEDFNDGLIGRRHVGEPAYNGPERSLSISWPGGETDITVTPEAKRTYAAILELLPEILEEQGLQ